MDNKLKYLKSLRFMIGAGQNLHVARRIIGRKPDSECRSTALARGSVRWVALIKL